MKNFLLICVSFFLFSCASTVESIKTDQNIIASSKTDTKQGYLLLGIDLNNNLKEMYLSGETSIRLTHKDLRKDSNYILLPLPAGQYEIEQISFNRFSKLYIRDDKEYWRFEVKENQVSYVGDLELKYSSFYYFTNYQMELVNNSSLALEFMEQRFPNILKLNAMSYDGPGEDEFLAKITGVK